MDDIIKKYSSSAKKYGDSPLSLGWGPKDRRNLRFHILTSKWDLTSCDILDIGCGLGDLYGFLRKKYGEKVLYTGSDINDDLLNIARKKYKNALFTNIDVLDGAKQKKKYDYVFISGVFNDYRENYLDFLKNSFKIIDKISVKGFSINFLSSTASIKYNSSAYYDAGEILNLGLKYSLNVQLQHDYMPFEFTIHVDKSKAIDQKFTVFEDFKKYC